MKWFFSVDSAANAPHPLTCHIRQVNPVSPQSAQISVRSRRIHRARADEDTALLPQPDRHIAAAHHAVGGRGAALVARVSVGREMRRRAAAEIRVALAAGDLRYKSPRLYACTAEMRISAIISVISADISATYPAVAVLSAAVGSLTLAPEAVATRGPARNSAR